MCSESWWWAGLLASHPGTICSLVMLQMPPLQSAKQILATPYTPNTAQEASHWWCGELLSRDVMLLIQCWTPDGMWLAAVALHGNESIRLQPMPQLTRYQVINAWWSSWGLTNPLLTQLCLEPRGIIRETWHTYLKNEKNAHMYKIKEAEESCYFKKSGQ